MQYKTSKSFDPHIFKNTHKPLKIVETLAIEYCFFNPDAELPINAKFPNVKFVKLEYNAYPSRIRTPLPSLKHLWFFEDNNYGQQKFEDGDILELLKLNPQLEKSIFYTKN